MIYPHEIVPLNQIDQNLHIKLELDDILKQNGINALKAKKITINRPQKKKNVSVPIKAPDSYSGYSQVHEMKIKRPENFKIPRVKSFLEKGFVNDAMPAKENAAASNLDEGSDGISSEISSSPSSIFREHNYSSFQVAGPLASDNEFDRLIYDEPELSASFRNAENRPGSLPDIVKECDIDTVFDTCELEVIVESSDFTRGEKMINSSNGFGYFNNNLNIPDTSYEHNGYQLKEFTANQTNNLNSANGDSSMQTDDFNQRLYSNNTDIINAIQLKLAEAKKINAVDEGKTITSGPYAKCIQIFGSPCLKYLNNECFELNCKFKHSMIPSDQVRLNLDKATKDEVLYAHNELFLKYRKLLENYFAAFCDYYGKTKQRFKLRKLIGVCKKYFLESESERSHLKDIVDGFVSSEMLYSSAVQIVLVDLLDEITQFQYNFLFEIILNNQNCKIIEQISHFQFVFYNDNYSFISNAIETLLTIVMEQNHEESLRYSSNLLTKCTITTLRSIRVSVLQQFLELCDHHNILVANQIIKRFKDAGSTFYY